MITGVNMSLVPEVEHVSHIAITSIKRVLLCTFVKACLHDKSNAN